MVCYNINEGSYLIGRFLHGSVGLWLSFLIGFLGMWDSFGTFLLDSNIRQGLCFITTFMKTHIRSQLSSMLLLHYGYIYKLILLDCDINKIKVLQGLGLVMFSTFLDFFSFWNWWRVIFSYDVMIGAYGGLWHSFVVMLYYGYVISWILLNYEICCKVL